MRSGLLLLMMLYLPIMFIGVVFGLMAYSEGGRTGLEVALVSVTPMLILWFFLKLTERRGLAAFREAAARIEPNFKHFRQASGIALDHAGQQIILSNGRHVRAYNFGDIREWKYNWQTGGKVSAGGLTQFYSNLSSAMDNSNASGLFIWVRDIDHPEWRISFRSYKHLQQWHERLQQLY